jgi:uncharacterized membrane protein
MGETGIGLERVIYQLSFCIQWLVTIELLAISLTPVFFKTLSKGTALSLARPVGVVVLTWLTALIVNTGPLFTSPSLSRSLFLLLLIVGLLLWRRKKAGLVELYLSKEALPLHGLYLVSFFIGLFFCFLSPDISSSERPMDMSYLMYFYRGGGLPTEDPWAAGLFSQYYSLSYLSAATLFHASFVHPDVGFHLMKASVLSLTLPSLYLAIQKLIKPSALIALALTAVAFCSVSYESLYLLVWEPESSPFSTYLKLSRILTKKLVTETPMWGYLYGDLHPYILAFMYECLSILLLTVLFQQKIKSMTLIVLLGITTGLLGTAHSWSLIPLGILCFVLGTVGIWYSKRELLLHHILVALFFALSFLVTLLSLDQGEITRAGMFWVNQSKRDYTATIFFRTYGYLFLPFLVTSALFTLIAFQTEWAERKVRYLSFLSALFVTFLLLLKLYFLLPLEIAIILGMLFSLSFSPLLYHQKDIQLIGGFALTSVLMLAFWEVGWLVHRPPFIARTMNSIHFMLTIGWLALAFYSCKQIQKPPLKWSFGILLIGYLAGSLANSLYVANLALTNPIYVNGTKGHLDGSFFLEKSDDFGLIETLRQQESLSERLLEAGGAPYSLTGRMGTFSGIPTYLGWKGHVSLRGVSKSELLRRKSVREKIYSVASAKKAWRLARRENITVVVVGSLEMKEYSSDSLSKFENNPKFFHLMETSGKSKLFRVVSKESIR